MDKGERVNEIWETNRNFVNSLLYGFLMTATTVSSKGGDSNKGDKNIAIQNIKVFSNAFESNSTISRKYTCSGEIWNSTGIRRHP